MICHFHFRTNKDTKLICREKTRLKIKLNVFTMTYNITWGKLFGTFERPVKIKSSFKPG